MAFSIIGSTGELCPKCKKWTNHRIERQTKINPVSGEETETIKKVCKKCEEEKDTDW